jgi:hypothetical protein
MASPATESGAGRGAGLALVTLGSGQFLMTLDSSVMKTDRSEQATTVTGTT